MRDDTTAEATERYPGAEMTPGEFESFVATHFDVIRDRVDSYSREIHPVVEAPDGTYEFDATVRWTIEGVSYFTVIEAKRHKNAIKRELVQVLHAKVQSVGANKGVLIATAPFQRGALKYAKAHGIALIKVTEGRHTYEVASSARPAVGREEARRMGLPDFVGHVYSASSSGTTRVSIFSTEYPELILEAVAPNALGGGLTG